MRKSETKILDASNTWLSNVIDYDIHGRSTAINGNNHLNPTVTNAEALSMSYDWADNALAETRTHTPGAAGATGAFSIQNTYTYDHAGRRTNFLTTIGGVNQHVAEYNYNHRDELVEKNLHANQVAAAWGWLQSVDFGYNAQGWLTGINTYANSATIGVPALCTPAMPNPPSPTRTYYNDANDVMYMDLRYDQTFGGIAGSIQKSGNIAQLAYRVRGRETTMYSYAYDYLSRLSSASFNEYSDAGVITASNKYNENLTYDLRGNIQTLQRTGYYTNGSSCTYGQIDNLTYSYKPNTNRLHKVLDATTTPGDAKSRGFNGNLSTIDSSMTYDRNGNLNKNLHKNVSTITYNHLNLPTVITFTTGNTIEFLYDAAGTKLRRTVKVGATVQYVQDYLPGGIEYRQTGTGVKRVESVFHAEGRYYNTNVDVSSTIAWRKEYNFKDHLGNTRLVFTDRGSTPNGIVDITGTASTSDVLQENHYYAFGLAFEGAWLQNDATVRDNAYQYNGKELHNDFGFNMYAYGMRYYDPVIGRFGGVDPISDQFPFVSTFNYAENEPIANIDLHGLQKTRPPKIEHLDKPSDLFSMKMVRNFVEGVKYAASETMNAKKSIEDKIESNPRLSLGLSGAKDLTLATVGTIGSIVAAPETGGMSLLAFPLGFGEMGLGMAKVINSIRGKTDEKDPVNKAGTLPGLVAHSAKSKNADFIDALGGFAPGMVSGGNIWGGISSARNAFKALVKEDNLVKAVKEGASAYDAYDDSKKVVKEMKNLGKQ